MTRHQSAGSSNAPASGVKRSRVSPTRSIATARETGNGRHDCYKTHRLTVTEIRVRLAGEKRRCRRAGNATSRRRRHGPLEQRHRRPVVAYIHVCNVSSATRFDLAGQSHRGGGGEDKTRVLHTYDFRGDVAAWKKLFSRLLVRPIPMRKANPAFCDRSKSHKKLDPFDDRKMVHWLAENPFLVRSSAISVPMMTVRACVRRRCVSRICAGASVCGRGTLGNAGRSGR